jgi:hypothetical protein
LFQKIFKGYIFCFLGHLVGRYIFDLSAHETNLMKKRSVVRYPKGYKVSYRIATIKISVRILLKSKGHLNAKVLHNSNKSIQKDKQVIKD